MNIKITVFSIIGICIVIFSVIAIANFNHMGNYSVDMKNLSNEQLIIKAIEIQYGKEKKQFLPMIYTSDFIAGISSDSHFYKANKLYTIDMKFMDTFKSINDDKATVSVRVEDKDGSYIQVITLTKDSMGKYLISKIEYDI